MLRGHVRSGDTTGRLGGDEFVVVLPDVTDAATALRIAGSIVSACLTPFSVAGAPVTIGASIGVSLTGQDAPIDSQELLRRADVAMYQVKRQRGDEHILLYDLGMDLDPESVPEPTQCPVCEPGNWPNSTGSAAEWPNSSSKAPGGPSRRALWALRKVHSRRRTAKGALSLIL